MTAGLVAIPGVSVGHWTHPTARTGCTVVVLPEPNVVAVETRGAAPGSRETALLAPGMKVEMAQAIVLTGGSAFGLAAADGVVAGLESQGRGHPTPAGPVPIVPAAVVFDLMEGDGSVRPGPVEGRAAFESASAAEARSGRIGAGAGCTVGQWRGMSIPSGLGSAVVEVDDARVAAMAVVNAVGDVFALEGDSLTGGTPVPARPPFLPSAGQNTTLAVVATDASYGRAELTRLAIRGQDALSVCIRPSHTRFDGDTVFAVSCGAVDAPLDLVAEAAFEAVGRAIEAAVKAARAQVG
ncbi:MAG: P1 family peptidase [Acidimicrobiia bacterium]|nr:P1 family peptidase [Acidimicrobiia bacterium]